MVSNCRRRNSHTTDWGENDLKINRDHETRDTRVARVTCTCTNGVLHLPGCMRVP